MRIINTYAPGIACFGTLGEFESPPRMALLAVLTQDDNGQYAAYVGLVPYAVVLDDDPRGRFAHRVAAMGNKIPYRELAGYFRGIEEGDYRR